MNLLFRTLRGSVPDGPLEFPAKAGARASGLLGDTMNCGKRLLCAGWSWLREQQQSRSRSRRLHLEETISLGQKRFVALIRVDGHRLLVGGGATDVALLANLDAGVSFSTLIQESATKTVLAPVSAPAKRTRKRAAKPKVGSEKCA